MIEMSIETADYSPLLSRTHSLRELCDKQSLLQTRLENGYNKIEIAAQQGQDVTPWEALWQELLSEYEQVSDEIASIAMQSRSASDVSD